MVPGSIPGVRTFVYANLSWQKNAFSKNKARKKWCRDPGSNRGPPDLQSDALPTELSRLCKLNDTETISIAS